MKRLLKSSAFWTAVIGSIFMFLTVLFIHSDVEKDLILYEFILFGGRTAVSGFSDIIKAQKGITYDEDEQKEKIIK